MEVSALLFPLLESTNSDLLCEIWLVISLTAQKCSNENDTNSDTNIRSLRLTTYKTHNASALNLRKREKSDSVLWQSPFTNRKIKKTNWQNKTPPKTSITQQLHTDLGWQHTDVVNPVYGITKPSHYPHKLCNRKDTHLNFCKLIL